MGLVMTSGVGLLWGTDGGSEGLVVGITGGLMNGWESVVCKSGGEALGLNEGADFVIAATNLLYSCRTGVYTTRVG